MDEERGTRNENLVANKKENPMDTRDEKLSTLIDTLEYIEARQSLPVPNHLLETKTYSKIGRNAVIQAKPAAVHFEGFRVNERHMKHLTIINASTNVVRMHVIPPQTKYFKIHYKKREQMVPGLTLKCTIEFIPDEWRYYYDTIKIHSPGEDNLMIPIHGYPVMSTKGFPQEFTFPDTPVGHSVSYKFPLKNMAPVDFEYDLVFIQPHPAFAVYPVTGIIPANGEIEVTVTFTPFEFQTACMTLQLNISQFCSIPLLSRFIGTSKPGLLRQKTLSEYAVENSDIFDPRSVSPLDRGRFRRKRKPSAKNEQFLKMKYKGLQFPMVIKSPYAVAQVLNQEIGKLKAKDLRETMLSKGDFSETSRQVKEARFCGAVRQNVLEERQNQLRWQVKQGDEQISDKERFNILDMREKAYLYYRYNRQEDAVPQDEYARQETQIIFRRTIRSSFKTALHEVLFDTLSNNAWATRYAAITRFVQAVRKVIIRNRAYKRLNSLQHLVVAQCENNGTFNNSSDGDQNRTNQIEKGNQKEMQLNILLSASSIVPTSFCIYVPPDIKDEMAADFLGQVPVSPTQVVVKQKISYFNLQVPQMYRLQSYTAQNVYDASQTYISGHLVQHLREGAEDEILSLPHTAVTALVKSSIPQNEKCKTDLDVSPVEKEKEVSAETFHDLPLFITRPPDALFLSVNYSSLHIMNPTPGLQTFQAPFPYAEVDSEFHLCPLPRYFRKDTHANTHAATQRRYLDREDTIRSIMSWKKFPSQGLISLVNLSTLTNVWVPRWDNSFSTDLLPASVPHLLNGLSSEDLSAMVEEHECKHQEFCLTPDMVSAQFALVQQTTLPEDRLPVDAVPFGKRMPALNILVGSQGQLSREKREEDLEYCMTKKYNRLGAKIAQKKAHLNSMLTDAQLLLQ
ncbi:cilia- and flagella-associated protein 221-like isoform X2 [Pomacea canaliculata]|uniref:cilia- and flagella-associated protein 221-like isoform X2 n=1 Tax=Pomacea canaliculata TaxID=400727 RepID=UPI000D73FF7D|nr:cilia- and flagella-associated protein 221-like isoform X2 [Pomacea canaliculata]